MELIDKFAVVAEIDKRIQDGEKVIKNVPSSAIFGLVQAYKNILSFLDTLEVKEVDLEKEIASQYEVNYEEYLTYEEFADVAKHFYELGLKARKEAEK